MRDAVAAPVPGARLALLDAGHEIAIEVPQQLAALIDERPDARFGLVLDDVAICRAVLTLLADGLSSRALVVHQQRVGRLDEAGRA